MEEIKKQIAFMVSKNTSYNVGDVINSNDILANRNANRLSILEELKRKKAKTKKEEEKLLTIMAMEEARLEINPNLPAKQNSLYVTNSLNENQKEFNKIKKNTLNVSNIKLQNLKLELNGAWHKVACTSEVNRESDYNKKKQQMYDYWNGINGDYYMYLFQGKARVVEVLEEFEN